MIGTSYFALLPFFCYLFLRIFTTKQFLGEGTQVAIAWQSLMVLLYISNKVVAARATTMWSSTVLLFSNVTVADYFISFVFVTAEWTDPWFWGALVFDYLLLVLRDR